MGENSANPVTLVSKGASEIVFVHCQLPEQIAETTKKRFQNKVPLQDNFRQLFSRVKIKQKMCGVLKIQRDPFQPYFQESFFERSTTLKRFHQPPPLHKKTNSFGRIFD
jgi:CRISPR/Cas system Type II protein with McrA/HNH and RuvC-like nuclease domain